MSDSRIEPAAIRNHVIGPQDSTVAPIEELRLFLTQAVSYLFLRTDLPLPDLTLAHPLQAGVIWNQDPWSEVALANGRRMNALDMAEASLEGMAGVLGRLGTADWALPGWSGYADWYTHIIDLLRRLEFEAAAGHLEWVAKSLAFDGLEPEIARDVEVLYHEITPDLFVEAGSISPATSASRRRSARNSCCRHSPRRQKTPGRTSAGISPGPRRKRARRSRWSAGTPSASGTGA